MRPQRPECTGGLAQDEMTHMVAAVHGSCTGCLDVEQASRMSRAAGVSEQDE